MKHSFWWTQNEHMLMNTNRLNIGSSGRWRAEKKEAQRCGLTPGNSKTTKKTTRSYETANFRVYGWTLLKTPGFIPALSPEPRHAPPQQLSDGWCQKVVGLNSQQWVYYSQPPPPKTVRTIIIRMLLMVGLKNSGWMTCPFLRSSRAAVAESGADGTWFHSGHQSPRS